MYVTIYLIKIGLWTIVGGPQYNKIRECAESAKQYGILRSLLEFYQYIFEFDRCLPSFIKLKKSFTYHVGKGGKQIDNERSYKVAVCF